MDARTLAAPLVALVVGIAFGYVVRGPSEVDQPERSPGPSTIELPRELEERLTRIEQLLERSSLATSEPPTRAPLDEPTSDHTELLDELRALIAEERAAQATSSTHSLSAEAARWQELEVARRPIDAAALSALADEWYSSGRRLPPRYFTHGLADMVAEFGWPTVFQPMDDGSILATYAVDFRREWTPLGVQSIGFTLRDGRIVTFWML